MKKFAPIAAIALFAVAFTSCKKEWTCECSTTMNGTTTTVSGKTTKMTKKDAKAACEKDTNVGGVQVSCKIK
ncbi:MAG TPA: hypothetical protein VIN07_13625 [Flavipsychrobacter sp.]